MPLQFLPVCFIQHLAPIKLKRPRPSSIAPLQRHVLFSSRRLIASHLNRTPGDHSAKRRIAISTILASTALALALSLHPAIQVHAKSLLTGNTIFRRYLIVDPSAILRYSIPLPAERTGDPNPPVIRLIQEDLEKLGVHLRARGVAGLISGKRDIEHLQTLLAERQLDVLLDVPAKSRVDAAEALSKLETSVNTIASELGADATPSGPSFLPPNVLKMRQNIKDALNSRNSLKRVTNYDGTYILLIY